MTLPNLIKRMGLVPLLPGSFVTVEMIPFSAPPPPVSSPQHFLHPFDFPIEVLFFPFFSHDSFSSDDVVLGVETFTLPSLPFFVSNSLKSDDFPFRELFLPVSESLLFIVILASTLFKDSLSPSHATLEIPHRHDFPRTSPSRTPNLHRSCTWRVSSSFFFLIQRGYFFPLPPARSAPCSTP